MRSFEQSIEQMLWPEKRDKDKQLFANESGPTVGIIDRLTVDSYLEVPKGYIAPPLRPLVNLARRLLPFIGSGTDGAVKVGPFPKGMPVGLITNIDLLGSELPDDQRDAHRRKIGDLLRRAVAELKRSPDFGALLNNLTEELFAVSRCKDLVVNKGHYFGTDYFKEEPGLSDADKRALIAFLKTL